MGDSGLGFTISIGGAAGQGIATPGNILARIFARRGLHLYAYNAFQSIIRGEHIFLTLRTRDEEVRTHGGPWSENVGKRVVKSPKVYIRDSGIRHTLLGLGEPETLLGHPKVGASFEDLAGHPRHFRRRPPRIRGEADDLAQGDQVHEERPGDAWHRAGACRPRRP